jgi:hypothetical protein
MKHFVCLVAVLLVPRVYAKPSEYIVSFAESDRAVVLEAFRHRAIEVLRTSEHSSDVLVATPHGLEYIESVPGVTSVERNLRIGAAAARAPETVDFDYGRASPEIKAVLASPRFKEFFLPLVTAEANAGWTLNVQHAAQQRRGETWWITITLRRQPTEDCPARLGAPVPSTLPRIIARVGGSAPGLVVEALYPEPPVAPFEASNRPAPDCFHHIMVASASDLSTR